MRRLIIESLDCPSMERQIRNGVEQKGHVQSISPKGRCSCTVYVIWLPARGWYTKAICTLHNGTAVVNGYCGFSYATKMIKSVLSFHALFKGMWQRHSEVRRLPHLAASHWSRIPSSWGAGYTIPLCSVYLSTQRGTLGLVDAVEQVIHYLQNSAISRNSPRLLFYTLY